MSHEALVGRVVNAQTLTRDSRAFRVEVTSVHAVGPAGVEVYGYRQYPNRARLARRTAYPRLYFVPAAWLPTGMAS